VWCVENPDEGDDRDDARLARYRAVRDRLRALIADELVPGR